MKKYIVFAYSVQALYLLNPSKTLFSMTIIGKELSINHLPLIIASLAEMLILILVSDFVIIMLRENCNLKVVTLV